MKSARFQSLLVMLVLVGLVWTGCGRKHDDHDGHSHGDENEPTAGAWFKPGHGVILTEETCRSLGVETADVIERPLPLEIRFTTQVFGESHKPTAAETYHAECTAKAAGLVGQQKAAHVRPGWPVQLATKSGETLNGVVLGVNNALAIGDVEVLVGITNSAAGLKPGQFLTATIAIPREQAVSVVPTTALLRAAEGTFVYTVNGDAYYRTAVKVGAESERFVEITDGLLAGDMVVTQAVEKIWLIELRATKGGGHSH